MEDQPVNIIWYQLHLLANLANELDKSGTLIIILKLAPTSQVAHIFLLPSR
jgi:hypothetical protein